MLSGAAGAVAFTGVSVATLALLIAQSVVKAKVAVPEGVRIHGVWPHPTIEGAGLVELERTIESEPAGDYTLVWSGGRGIAKLAETVTATATTVTRRYFGETGVPVAYAKRSRVTSAPHRDVADLGLPWEDAEIETELGAATAWEIPALESNDDRWMIHVHGRGSSRAEPLRTVPLAAARGWNSLVVSYRNDAGAPRTPGRRYGLGLTEWRDVDAALEWAVARGATRILLAGWSMGGTIATQTYLRSRYAPLVKGIMLESPAVDWRATIDFQTSVRRLPDPAKRLANWLLHSRIGRWTLRLREGIDLSELDLVTRAQELEVPILLLHSTGDTTVPVAPSRRLAAANPEHVEYEEFVGARHVRLWNREPRRWEHVVGAWLDARG